MAHGCLYALTISVRSTVILTEHVISVVPAGVTWAIVCEIKWWAVLWTTGCTAYERLSIIRLCYKHENLRVSMDILMLLKCHCYQSAKLHKCQKRCRSSIFTLGKCHILVRKVPIRLTHLKEREREQGKERACSRPSKDNERFVCFGKKKEKSA